MTEEELKAKEAELSKKEKGLTEKEVELKKKEDDFKKKEDDFKKKEVEFNESDSGKLIKKVQDGFNKKLQEAKAECDAKIAEREKVINQLLEGNEDDANKSKKPSNMYDLINARRTAQNKKW